MDGRMGTSNVIGRQELPWSHTISQRRKWVDCILELSTFTLNVSLFVSKKVENVSFFCFFEHRYVLKYLFQSIQYCRVSAVNLSLNLLLFSLPIWIIWWKTHNGDCFVSIDSTFVYSVVFFDNLQLICFPIYADVSLMCLCFVYLNVFS